MVTNPATGSAMHLGFIGLGVMGRPMAEHLLRAGHVLHLWARPGGQAAAAAQALLAAAPATVVVESSPAAVARASSMVCTNVTSSGDVEGLAVELAAGFAPGAIHVDFSTIAPTVARQIAARYAKHQVEFVDAPVSGGAVGARNASLAIMWGGKSALAGRLDPLFSLLGQTIVRVGDVGAGQVAKACNQMVMVAAIQATAEAACLAAAAGVDFARVRAALQGGSAASRVLDVFGARMAERNFAAGVEARLHHKDFALLMTEATALGVPLPVAASVWQQLNALMGRGDGRMDSSALLRLLELK